MEQTKTDFFAILVSLVAFLIAVYGVVFQPVTVDSTRPTHLREQPNKGNSTVADARLWDDPFVVFPEDNISNVRPEVLSPGEQALILIVPTPTQGYQEDREARLRLRFAVQRALLDQGYAPRQGTQLASLSLGFPSPTIQTQRVSTALVSAAGQDTLHAPVQSFELTKLAEERIDRPGASQYKVVLVVWLPDEILTDAPMRQAVVTTIDGSLNDMNYLRCNEENRSYAVLGPWDAGELTRIGDLAKPQRVRNICIVSYRATVADAILDTGTHGDNVLNADDWPDGWREAMYLNGKPNRPSQVPVLRLPNRDDVLCKALLDEIRSRGTLSLHSRDINVWVFSEWDTLYGRSLAETFRALAMRNSDAAAVSNNKYWRLHEELVKADPSLAEEERAAGRRDIAITVVPYLRGLDGASTLYANRYLIPTDKDKDDDQKKQADRAVEPAEGTTQFDYIRRITTGLLGQQAPFLPHLDQPDAIVIFGSDAYDKLVLLEFLKQEIKNCAYFTTDLDALYWHPHYLQYTRDLVVASAFPLTMGPGICGVPDALERRTDNLVEFRDSYQSAAYLAVSRLIHGGDACLNESFFGFPRHPIIYRVGNTRPLVLDRPATPSSSSAGGSNNLLQNNIAVFSSAAGSIIEPITEGESPFWSMLIQLVVIGIGLVAIYMDIPCRTHFPSKAAEELWKSAFSLVPPLEVRGIQILRRGLRRKWKLLPVRTWCKARVGQFQACRGDLGIDSLKSRVEAICKHYRGELKRVRTKKDVVEVALYLLSDIFNLREFEPGKPAATVTARSLSPDIKPFANYLAAEFRIWPFAKRRNKSEDGDPGIRMVWWVMDWIRGMVPSIGVFVAGSISLTILLMVCLQPVPLMVGPESRTYLVRLLRWIVESGALAVTFLVFYAVCFEQIRFRKLIESLDKLVPDTRGLSKRQLLILIARSGELVGNLATTPCTLVFLLFVAHLRPLGGVALGFEELCLLVFGLALLLYSFLRLRSAALQAKSNVRESYESEKTTAARLIARLKSFVAIGVPIQDDVDSLKTDLKDFVHENTTLRQGPGVDKIYEKLSSQHVREEACSYLQACSERNDQIIRELGELRGGVLAPLLNSPFFNALLIPVGGAGGISLIAYLVSLIR